MDKRTLALMGFLDSAHSVFHAVAGLEKALLEAGYQALNEWDAWDLIPGGATAACSSAPGRTGPCLWQAV